LDGFGRLLHDGWLLKKKMAAKISDAGIDAHYERGIDAGALGGKVAGAGGGGFLLFYTPPAAQKWFLESMKSLRRVPFQFCSTGSRVIYVDNE
jgi:D-glycero-alpha-D-manno-heptose-7-phosphate kinase